MSDQLPIELEMALAEQWQEDWPDGWYTAVDDAADEGNWELILDIRARVYSLQVAIAAARRKVDMQIAEALGEGGSVHDGQTFHRASINGALKVRDPEGLLRWAGDDAALLFNPNTARVTAMRMIAEGRNEDPRSVEDTFFHRPGNESDLPELTSKPLTHEKTPKYAQTMEPYEPRNK